MSTTLSDTKQSLLAELQERVEDKILEPSNAALLSKLITNAENDDEALAIAALGTTYKRTGFHWDKRLEKMTDTVKYFKRNDALSFGEAKKDEPVHKLIIGDNYDALQNLLIEFLGKVDVIYIDPPYSKDSMGSFSETEYENAISRDNLLSMLYFRLQIAKQLLSDDGVIFCSIDDKNYAYLKCLFDEVFRESSYVTTLTVESSVIAGPRRVPALQGSIVKTAEYCLVYSRSGNKKIMKKLKYDYIDGFDTHYSNWLDEVNGKIISFNELMQKNLFISNKFNTYNLEVSIQNLSKLITLDDSVRNWLYSQDISSKLYRLSGIEVIEDEKNYPFYKLFQLNNKWYIRTNDGVINVFRYIDRIGLCDDYFKRFGERAVRGNLWKGFSSDGGNLDKEGFVSYKGGKKPLRLVKQLIDSVCPSKDSVILDFFAGSGTTGQAVLELNKEDGGNRRFILCQMNEDEYKIAYDVTCKRLKRVMTGKCYDEKSGFKTPKSFTPYGGKLEVYEIAEVSNASAIAGKTPFDVIDETLYGKEKFKTAREKIEWVCSNFAHTQMEEPKDE